MITFTDYLILIYKHSANHWIRSNITCSKFSQFDTAVHVYFIFIHQSKSSGKMYYCTMTIQQAYQQLLLKLYELYDDREAINISDIVIENVTGFRKIDRIMNKQFPLNAQQQELLEDYANALMQHKPVQYV